MNIKSKMIKENFKIGLLFCAVNFFLIWPLFSQVSQSTESTILKSAQFGGQNIHCSPTRKSFFSSQIVIRAEDHALDLEEKRKSVQQGMRGEKIVLLEGFAVNQDAKIAMSNLADEFDAKKNRVHGIENEFAWDASVRAQSYSLMWDALNNPKSREKKNLEQYKQSLFFDLAYSANLKESWNRIRNDLQFALMKDDIDSLVSRSPRDSDGFSRDYIKIVKADYFKLSQIVLSLNRELALDLARRASEKTFDASSEIAKGEATEELLKFIQRPGAESENQFFDRFGRRWRDSYMAKNIADYIKRYENESKPIEIIVGYNHAQDLKRILNDKYGLDIMVIGRIR